VTGSRREAIAARVHPAEMPDPVPLEMPAGYGGPPTMRELVQTYVEETLSKQAVEDDFGTFEEEDDFEIEEQEMLDLSGYEVREYEMVEEVPQADASPAEGPPVEESPAPSEAPPVNPGTPAEPAD